MIKLKCVCCGFEKEFADHRAAFDAGWDDGVWMKNWPVTCDLCPGVCAKGLVSHAKAHAHWAEHGRPAGFGPFCYDDENFGMEMDLANDPKVKALMEGSGLSVEEAKDALAKVIFGDQKENQ